MRAQRVLPSPRPRHAVPVEAVPSKDEAPCCNEKRDALGRLPIGYCGPGCLRRPHLRANAPTADGG